MMGPIVLYTHAKNSADSKRPFGEKPKNHHTDGQTDRQTE